MSPPRHPGRLHALHAVLFTLTRASRHALLSTSLNLSLPGLQLLVLLWLVIEDHDNLFVMAEVVHFLGIGVLLYKLTTKRNAGGELAIPTASWQGLGAAVSVVLSCCTTQLAVKQPGFAACHAQVFRYDRRSSQRYSSQCGSFAGAG